MRAIGAARVARCSVQIGICRNNWIYERHQTSELDSGSVCTRNVRHIASMTSDRNRRSNQGDVANLAPPPSHIEDSFRTNSFPGSVATKALPNPEVVAWPTRKWDPART